MSISNVSGFFGLWFMFSFERFHLWFTFGFDLVVRADLGKNMDMPRIVTIFNLPSDA